MQALKSYWKIAGFGFLCGLAVFVSIGLKGEAPAGPLPGSPVAAVEYAEPVRVSIPAIGVDAPVQTVGRTEEGNMDVTRDQWSVGWYKHSSLPGRSGSAVLAGHLNTKLTPTAVFYDLNKLKPGDEVLVKEANGTMVKFRVKELKTYPYDARPEEVFAADGESRLSLITCAGIWLPAKHSYSERLVVFAERAV